MSRLFGRRNFVHSRIPLAGKFSCTCRKITDKRNPPRDCFIKLFSQNFTSLERSTFFFFLFSFHSRSRRHFNPFLSKFVAKARHDSIRNVRYQEKWYLRFLHPPCFLRALFPFHSKSLRHTSKGDLSSAARPPCTMHVRPHTHTRARTDERRDREKNRIPRQTGTFRAVFASRPQQSPFPLSHPARIVSFEYDQRELT